MNNPTLFSLKFRERPLFLAVVLSAIIHTMAFYLFPAWGTLPSSEKATVIRIHAVLENLKKPEEKLPTDTIRSIPKKPITMEKNFEKLRPQTAIKSARIAGINEIANPPLSVIKNPVAMPNQETLFQPTSRVQHPAADPAVVAVPKKIASIEIPRSIEPALRQDTGPALKTTATIARPQRAMQATDSQDSLQDLYPARVPAAKSSKTASLAGTAIAKAGVSVRDPGSITFSNTPRQPSRAKTQDRGTLRHTRTAAIRQPYPVEIDQILRDNQPVGEIGRLNNSEKNERTETSRIPGIRSRVPSELTSETLARSQPAAAVSENHMASSLKNTSLLQIASIPLNFSDDSLSEEEKSSDRGSQKTVRLEGGGEEISSETWQEVKNGFSERVWSRIAQHKYYPRMARKRGFEGQPVVAFTLDNQGNLIDFSIVNPSPFKLLDEAARDAVESASPYPPIPELLNMQSIRFKLPISFILEEP